jgi:hypothetical protein
MIGRRDEAHAGSNNYVYVIGADRLSDLDAICTTANATYTKLDLDYRFNDPKIQTISMSVLIIITLLN